MKLKDKVAIVTGSSRGIGKAVAKLYAAEGAKVVVTGRSEVETEKLAGSIHLTVQEIREGRRRRHGDSLRSALRRPGVRAGRSGGGGLRPGGHPGEQRSGERHDDVPGDLGQALRPDHGRQRQGLLPVHPGGAARDAGARKRRHHQHQLGGGEDGRRVAAQPGLRHIEGRGGPNDARPLRRAARPRNQRHRPDARPRRAHGRGHRLLQGQRPGELGRRAREHGPKRPSISPSRLRRR